MRRNGLTISVLVGAVASGGVAMAEGKQPAPDYFIDTIVATTTAENIALSCPSLTFDTLQASQTSAEVIANLAADGFDAKNLESTMEDPAERIRTQQTAFLEKHGLPKEGASFEMVCAAGMAEITAETAIGSFLLEITGDGAVDPTQKSDGN